MSKFMSLNSADFLKGLLMAVLSAVISVLYTSVESGTLAFDWKAIQFAAITAVLAYLTKNLFTNSQGNLMQKG